MENLKLQIVKSLYFLKPQSIAELASSIGKSVPNITKAVNNLLQEDLIIDSGLAPSTGGRRAAQFELNREVHPYLIAVAIDQYKTSITVFDVHNNQLVTPKEIENPLLDSDRAFKNVIDLIEETVNLFLGHSFLGIGITMPGFVEQKTGINNSYTSKNPLFKLKDHIQQHFNLPTYIENDSSAIAIAEKKFGKAIQSQNALIINLNWGVGLGMIVNNQLFRGHSGYAGEFSHIPLSNNNKLCSCGKKGCIEVDASLLSAIEFVNEKIKSGEESVLKTLSTSATDSESLITAVQNGDQLAISAVQNIAYMLGKGISTLIHIMNPEKIIISGRGADFGNILLLSIQSSVQEFSIPRLSKNTTIELSTLEHIQLLGSACVLVEQAKWKTKQLQSTEALT
ncbi:ROK family protein [Sphingobacterium hungaricum]|uniref:ROK family protein n=1 Tax=Sphingobacterium hungaricum TaxID=2082723 RepID=UPI001E399146|nr:ROK family protein [Sphingobacterium hungaricum]